MLRWIIMNFLILELLARIVLGRAIGHDSSLWSRNSEQHINQTRSANITWGGYNINTNYYESAPDTNVVREYYFDIVNTTAAPDGVERPVLLVNGQFPGPTIEANWGDTVKVHVTNRMQNNGTAIHFHGIRQQHNNQMDGVPSLTQCPVAPGSSYTYVWKATQYGTSWYHSHFSLQAWEGVFGAIVIHGPTTAEYDEDLGPLILSDWSHQTVDEMYQTQLEVFRAARMEGGLLNGKNVWIYEDGKTVGERFKTTFVPGKRYRIRLINTAVHTHFRFSIDQHNLTIIANDFVPIVPFETNAVPIDMGQRYDIIVTADQVTDNYWMRAVPQLDCSNNTAPDNIKGVVHYQGAETNTDPTSIKWPNLQSKCDDFPFSQLVPWVGLDAHISGTSKTVHSEVSFDKVGDIPLYLWTLGGDYFNNSWSNPTLQQLEPGNAELMTDRTMVEVSTPNQWVILVIQTFFRAPHPIHLHGMYPCP